MGKKTIIFNQLIEALNKKKFTDLVKKHDADRYVKHFDSWSHCLALIFAQLNAQESLRAIEMNFGYAISKQNLRTLAKPKRTTLSEANNRRPAEFFQDVCAVLISQLKKMDKKCTEALQLIDSTPFQITGRGTEWVERTQRIKGLKAHFIYDTTEKAPVYFSITGAKTNDIVEAQQIELKANQTLVFDRAYYDFAWWNQIIEAGSSFVTRPKSTLVYKLIKRHKVTDESVKSDYTIKLMSKKSYKYKGELRLVKAKVKIRGINKSISVLTNNFKDSAEKIINLYKKRWEIELFFKWIKQNLKIKKFFSQNENGIKIQVLTAIITYLLLRIMQMRSKKEISLRKLITFLRSNLFCKVKYKKGNKAGKIDLPKPVLMAQVGLT